MHTSLVYRILAEGVPPGDPFVAGAPCRYAWAHHALVAGGVRWSGLAPPTLFAALNVALLGASVLALDRAAARVAPARASRVFSVALALYAASLLARGPLWHAVRAATGLGTESRILPIEKFVHVNSNGFGVLGFALALGALLALWGPGARRPAAALAALAGATFATALLYPLAWLPLVACAAVASAVLAARAPRARWRSAAGVALALAAGTAPALPYLLGLQEGRGAGPAFEPTASAFQLARKAATVAGVVALPALLAWLERDALVRRVRARPEPTLGLVAAAATGAALYLGIDAPTDAEYKFLLCGALAAALAIGPELASLHARRPVAALALLALALVPVATHGAELLGTPFGDTSRVAVRGPLLEERDPVRAALDRWIREETPPDAVFVDSELAIPPYAHRRTFALVDPGVLPLPGGDTLHGWSLAPSFFLHHSFGHDLDALAERYRLSLALLAPAAPPPSEAQLAQVRRLAAADAIYVVVRDPVRQRPLDGDARFERVFAAGPARVYRLRGGGEPAGRPAAGGAGPQR
jgi:hypothetical protein